MKGNFYIWIKRWVLAALVFTLGLSLTSCGKGRQNLMAMWQSCDDTSSDGAGWQFDVAMKAKGGSYILEISPYAVTPSATTGGTPTGEIFLYGPGQNGQGAVQPLTLAGLEPGSIIEVPINPQYLNLYDTLVIQEFTGTGGRFLDASTNTTTFCAIPEVGGSGASSY